jgi:hypothetical protein
MMAFFRVIAMALPLLLISLLVAGSKDMLGGWNQTNDALSTVLILFLLGPVVALALLVTELVGCYKAKQGARCKAFLFIGLAILIFIEALAVDYYLLTQLRM